MLALERQVQSLRLELTEQHQLVANLKNELQRQRDAEDAPDEEPVFPVPAAAAPLAAPVAGVPLSLDDEDSDVVGMGATGVTHSLTSLVMVANRAWAS